MNKNLSQLLILLCLPTFFFSCQSDDDEQDYDGLSHFYRNIDDLDVEIAYEEGAMPYSIRLEDENIWDFTTDNIKILFSNTDLNVNIDRELSDMIEIPNQNKDTYTSMDLLELSRNYQHEENTPTKAHLFLLFVDGYFEDNEGNTQQNVIGVNITSTPITAVFVPVVERSSFLRTTQAFIEQTTVIHELGHALGLVNNGVPLTSNHQDIANGAHCTNIQCVMYFQNQGLSNMVDYVRQLEETGTVIVFGQECIDDTRAFKP